MRNAKEKVSDSMNRDRMKLLLLDLMALGEYLLYQENSVSLRPFYLVSSCTKPAGRWWSTSQWMSNSDKIFRSLIPMTQIWLLVEAGRWLGVFAPSRNKLTKLSPVWL